MAATNISLEVQDSGFWNNVAEKMGYVALRAAVVRHHDKLHRNVPVSQKGQTCDVPVGLTTELHELCWASEAHKWTAPPKANGLPFLCACSLNSGAIFVEIAGPSIRPVLFSLTVLRTQFLDNGASINGYVDACMPRVVGCHPLQRWMIPDGICWCAGSCSQYRHRCERLLGQQQRLGTVDQQFIIYA